MTQALEPRATQLTDAQVALLKDTVCRGASDTEFQLAVQICNRLQLDPFARQIYFVKRWDTSQQKEVMASQISIDGMRLIAERSGQYRGQTEPQWCGPDGLWRNVWLGDEPPEAARCGVYKDQCVEPIYAVASYRSYASFKKDGAPTTFWKRMPEVMLHKCAESLALRKAFPAELSGVYTEDEMGQAESAPIKPAKVTNPLITFRRQLDEVRTRQDLDRVRPPSGISAGELKTARAMWVEKQASFNDPENINQDINPETGEVLSSEATL